MTVDEKIGILCGRKGKATKIICICSCPDYGSAIYLDDAHDIRIQNFTSDKPEGKLQLVFENKVRE